MQRACVVLALMVGLWVNGAWARPLSPEQVPEPLKPWVPWVLQDEIERTCPFVFNQYEQKYCSWPGELILDLRNTQANFVGYWQLEQEGWVFLPGDEQFWPQQVTLQSTNGKSDASALVIPRNNRPALKLKPGHYQIQGVFNWDFIPERLRIPEETGLISLSVNGVTVSSPAVKDGMLWLKDSDRGGAQVGQLQDNLELQVFRQIIDDVPLQVLTHIDLDVAGTAREAKLSQALLPGYIPMRLDSPLPTRFEGDGQVVVQVRPGHWQLTLLARQHHPSERISLQAQATWPSSEIWTFAARPSLRVVEVDGLDAVDPAQTSLPGDWQSLPAYRITAGQAMDFKVMRRGNPDPEPNQLHLKRQLWLDFDGAGYTAKDQMTGIMTRDWRLDSLPETLVGRVSLNGANQLITRSAAGTVGFEVRQGALDMQADSRYQGDIGKLSVTGWQQTFQSVQAEINLPPGWRLLATRGVDNVPTSWVAQWTLLDIFLVLIASLAVARLSNLLWGLFTLVTLVLIWQEAGAPQYSWLNLLIVIGFTTVVPPGKILNFLTIYRKISAIALLLLAIPFMLTQIRVGIFPQLAMPWLAMQTEPRSVAPAAPASPSVQMSEQVTAEYGDQLLKAPERLSARKAKNDYTAVRDQAYALTDTKASVQTGPGLPQWQWHKLNLSWNGAVDSGQRVRLWYLSPLQNGMLNILRVLLVALLWLLLCGQLSRFFKSPPPSAQKSPATAPLHGSALGLCVLLVCLLPCQPTQAEFPPQAVLDELKTRLLEAPDCLPACAQIAQLHIAITPENLQLTLSLDAQASVALPLPAQQHQWLPEQVSVDGSANAPLLRDPSGQLWLQVAKGRHQVVLQGKTPAFEKFSLALSLKPHYVTLTQTGWEQTGVHEHGIADPQLQFTRVAKTTPTGAPTVAPTTLPPLFRIERTLQLGLDWHVHTEVLRLTPVDSATLLSVPLLPGESILTPGMRVEQQQVLLNINAAQAQVGWDSVLAKQPALNLTAPETSQWTEVWRVVVGSLWHLQSEGIAPVHPGQPASWEPEWRPLPGEQLRLHITRPEAVSGQTLTVDYSRLNVIPGRRITENNLSLQVKSSQGGQHALTLPAAAELQVVKIDGILQPLRQQGRTLTLPVKPGAQTWELAWQQQHTFGTRFTTPPVDIGLASVNSHIQLNVSAERWILFAFGPSLGPAVLFWGMLILITLLTVGVARANIAPLNQRQWFLLLIGLSQVPLSYAFMVVAWFGALTLRARYPARTATAFNSLQLALAGLTVLAGLTLFLAVEQGLLGAPDMQISGNQSNAYQLNWYQDRTDKQLPVAGIISVPLLVYRGLMLAWSLWLAIAVLRWLPWGWRCFAAGGIWRKSLPRAEPTKETH